METAQIQLVFNVIAITGVSSIASLCYLRRKDRKLAAETTKSAAAPSQQSQQSTGSAPTGAATTQQDIRRFAAERRTGWVNGIAALSSDGSC